MRFVVAFRCFSTHTMKILNVAEKNDVAKNVSEILSNGRYKRREGLSKYNKIYEFEANVMNQRCSMVMTSVSGHLLNYEFVGSYRSWQSCNPLSLFDAPVLKACPQDAENIKKTLERETLACSALIIWTDCDREGENIGFEIINVCKNIKNGLRVQRARFSELTSAAVWRALRSLQPPDEKTSNAVDVRQELDLRIGAAFTRFQTLRLQKVFPQVLNQALISYGSCQFPTLGFVVERYKQVTAFVPEPFWKLVVNYEVADEKVSFSWKRHRLFDHTACLVLHHICIENPVATVTNVQSKPKSKWRPLPLDTVEFEKIASRKLRMNAKTAMTVAERLYTQGYISYPRTETNIFPPELNLTELIQMHVNDPQWGDFARRVAEEGPNPRRGNKSDNAHPPIHPTKHVDNLQGDEKRVYEFVVRHFLACCSKDAEGQETTVEIDVANEKFMASGLIVLARNYLDVYPYENWTTKIIPRFEVGQTFQPSSIEMVESATTSPSLLTEADLIALMDKHGIGTDATHAEHIETIKQRSYVGLSEQNTFLPGTLGKGLVDGYDSMGFAMSKPHLRAELEADLKRICEGTKDPRVVLSEQIAKYRQVFEESVRQAEKLDAALAEYYGVGARIQNEDLVPQVSPTITKCPQCSSDIVFKSKRNGNGFFISCLAYPQCKSVIWLPECVEGLELGPQCTKCGVLVNTLKFRFKPGSLFPLFPNTYEGCLGGCEPNLLEALDVRSLRSLTCTINNTATPRVNSRPSQQNGQLNIPLNRPNTNINTARQQNAFFNADRRQNRLPALENNSRTNETNVNITCGCGDRAVELTVKKDGPNKGRQFFKCSKPQGSNCNFFAWKDEASAQNEHTRDNSNTNRNRRPEPNEPSCSCSLPAKKLTVQRDGPNKGREYFTCSKYGQEKCSYFQWVDEMNRAAPGRARSNAPGNNQRSRMAGSKRKCSVCGSEGHNKRNCPNK